MTEQHPITPPPELVEQWLESTRSHDCIGAYPPNYEFDIATTAARWGADQELEACCAIAISDPVCGTKNQRNMLVRHIREQRRPKPQSLKEQALEVLNAWCEERHGPGESILCDGLLVGIIRRALEVLDD